MGSVSEEDVREISIRRFMYFVSIRYSNIKYGNQCD